MEYNMNVEKYLKHARIFKEFIVWKALLTNANFARKIPKTHVLQGQPLGIDTK